MAKKRLNSYAGQLKNATPILGMLHACYGLGCAISPIAATRMLAEGYGWNSYYYVLLGCAVLNTISFGIVFHPKFMKEKAPLNSENLSDFTITGPLAIPKIETEEGVSTGIFPKKKRGPLMFILSKPFCWMLATFMVLYLGLEISLGGWIVEFMIQVLDSHSRSHSIQVRHGQPYSMSYVATGFWLGITVGRICLAFPAHKWGEKPTILVYNVIALGFQFLFWFVPSIPVSAVSAAFVGVFIGPMFPCAVSLATRVLPGHLHVSVIGFITAFGMEYN